MRRKLALGLGLAGILSGSAFSQFAADRPPAPPTAPVTAVAPVTPSTPPAGTPTPALPPGVRPLGSGSPGAAYVPPVGGIGTPGSPLPVGATPAPQPANAPPTDLEIRSALGPNHPWAVKPEHGAYFICVKSYSRPSRPDPNDPGLPARELAEMLASEIRELYRVQAFLYEYVSEERKAEVAAIAAARERAKLFADQLEKYKQQAALQGMEFMAPDTRVRFKTVNYRDQIAVLVGGFQSEDDARKALDKVRTWADPKNKGLMDGTVMLRAGKDGKQESAQGHINPYKVATVVANPSIAKNTQPGGEQELDPFIVKLNEGRPYSLLKATKGWTLAVKSFTAPVQIVGLGGESGGGFMKKVTERSGADQLRAGTVQAEELAKALREMKRKDGTSLGLEAFVLHTRNASLVTVGQYDSPSDPALIDAKRLLSSFQVRATEDETGTRPVANTPAVFGNLLPIPIPKVK